MILPIYSVTSNPLQTEAKTEGVSKAMTWAMWDSMTRSRVDKADKMTIGMLIEKKYHVVGMLDDKQYIKERELLLFEASIFSTCVEQDIYISAQTCNSSSSLLSCQQPWQLL